MHDKNRIGRRIFFSFQAQKVRKDLVFVREGEMFDFLLPVEFAQDGKILVLWIPRPNAPTILLYEHLD